MNQLLRNRHWNISITSLLMAALCLSFLPSLKRNAVLADHTFTVSAGIYRIPYANGTAVTALDDHHNHPVVLNRVDLGAADNSTVVAAASGIIRGIVDRHGDSNDLGDGLAADGSPHLPQYDDSDEHACENDQYEEGDDIPPGSEVGDPIPNSAVTGLCAQYNNYVWIEHPNGEWTKYTHMATGSVTAPNGFGWQEGDQIFVGQAIGIQSDIGAVGIGPHVHFEVAAIPPAIADPDNDPATPPDPFGEDGGTAFISRLGGFIDDSAWNVVTVVCFSDGDDNGDSLYTDGESYTSGPCVNTAPTADAGGPYFVNEGSMIQLDGTNSSDPHNAILTYSWAPGGNLSDPTIARPTYAGLDDSVENLTLTVSDIGGDVTAATALTDNDGTTVTVLNVPPSVFPVGDNIFEGSSVTVTAAISDPGIFDTHTATIDWDDGTAPQAVTPVQLTAGVSHVYGDNGIYHALVTVTDDDGGIGSNAATIIVGNLNPTATLDTTGTVAFPGGDFMVVDSGTELPASADGSDPGSDDLTFSWSTGDLNTYFNNGISADLPMSSQGTFPFNASDSIDALYAAPGVETLNLVLSDDDGGSDNASAGVIVTGTADSSQGIGWWKHQYSGTGSPQIDAATLEGYLEIVNAVSSVFSETYLVPTIAAVHTVLSPMGSDRRDFARAQLMAGWLQFASGAVAWDATIQVDNETVGFLPLMFNAEAVINNPAATDAELLAVERALARLHPAN